MSIIDLFYDSKFKAIISLIWFVVFVLIGILYDARYVILGAFAPSVLSRVYLHDETEKKKVSKIMSIVLICDVLFMVGLEFVKRYVFMGG